MPKSGSIFDLFSKAFDKHSEIRLIRQPENDLEVNDIEPVVEDEEKKAKSIETKEKKVDSESESELEPPSSPDIVKSPVHKRVVILIHPKEMEELEHQNWTNR